MSGEDWGTMVSEEPAMFTTRMTRLALTEYRSAMSLFEDAWNVFDAALRGVDSAEVSPTGAYPASMASLYEVVGSRAVWIQTK